jgi:hypothetical protein
MWTTLLLLAIAVNFEPTRVAMVAIMISGPHPVRQTLTFLLCAFGLGAAVGLLVLFALDFRSFGSDHVNSSVIQIGIGALMILGAVAIGSNIGAKLRARKKSDQAAGAEDEQSSQPTTPTGLKRVATRVHGQLHGKKSWFSGAAGLVLALPTGEYLALLALIAVSEVTDTVKASALFLFLFIANLGSSIPLASYLIAPVRTRNAVQRFNNWVLARTRRQVSAVLGAVGLCLVVTGVF